MESNLPNELDVFRGLISKEKDLTDCSTDDGFLMQFLRAKDMKPDSALVTLKKYMDMRRKVRICNPDAVRKALECGSMSVLKNRDSQGRQILFGINDRWDPNEVGGEDLFMALLLFFEQMICSVETQQNGIVLIADLSGFAFSHCTRLRYQVLLDFVRMFQGSFPIRMKELHFVNQPKIFGIVYTLVYPLLSDKLKNRLHFHGKDLPRLQNVLPRESLPQSVGGLLRDDLAIDQEFIPKIISTNDYL